MNWHHSIITYKISEGLSVSITYRIDQLQAVQVMFPKNTKIAAPLLLLLKRKSTLFIKRLFKNLNRVIKDQFVPKTSSVISAYRKDYRANNVRRTKKKLR